MATQVKSPGSKEVKAPVPTLQVRGKKHSRNLNSEKASAINLGV